MSSSKTEICNVALSMFGAQRIISLSDSDTEEAKLCNAVYDVCRLDLLDLHSWNCAIKRASLNQLTATPDWDYSYQYELPSDYIRVLEVKYEKDYPYVIEGNQLLTDYEYCNIKYIYDVEDVSQFSSRFSMTLSTYIAATICYNLTESRPMAELMLNLFKGRLAQAKALDGQEGKITYNEVSSWLEARDI